MSYRLSLLDKSPILDGESATNALARTVALAQKAERWGFHRFWVAEHHGMAGLASPAPEILVSYILASTSRIRVGSGGVLLQHYSAYKVAESFNLLASLAPGRVDLGIGKAPGGLPFSTQALQALHDPARKPSFSEHLRQLDGFLNHAGQPSVNRALATPIPPKAPERFLLGASPESATLAAEHGWQFVFAGQLNGDLDTIERSFDAYAKAGGEDPLLAVAALVAKAQGEAEAMAAGLRVFRLHLDNGPSVNLGSEAQAAEFARQAGAQSYRTEERTPSVLAGTAAHVRRELDRLHQRFGVGEFILDTPVAAKAERLASIELIANEILAVDA
ncbi:MsnO8 family LLM class oxidoreductase [Bosea caraganae]|uniref:MsnO8 family LLM class oxidoreductase n=1 Tax=Bosea caraganae TaxID=2763117 RepID=A0A370LCM0_9HYPH|nr:MsnO8 family LLM class oxidoreductase [Bosea caraganae]RDJ27710.1 MsnO8 family LLM class oxidoreductase [Bosea caraganae]RDJ29723.1 MsnO8 family LLM class oxidoreductase [Bosea caraganae]